MIHERKNNELYLIKIKIFCSVKYTVKRMKLQGTDWKTTFSKHTYGNEIVSKMFKGTFEKTYNSILKIDKESKE
jgi:hypothetical protein